MPQPHPLTLDDVIRFPWAGATHPHLSPDGQQVVYECEGQLWLAGAGEAEPLSLGEGAQPCWLPGGDEIAFLRGQPAQVWIREANGHEKPLNGCPAGVVAFAWSPDGGRVVIVAPLGEAAAVEPDGPALGSIVEVHRRRLAPGCALWVTERSSGASWKITQSEPGIAWSSPAWRPDGRALALLANVFQATGGERQTELVVVDLETGAMSYPAGGSKRLVGSPSWSPDGARLAFPYSPHDYAHPFRFVCGVVPAGGGVECLAEDYSVDSVCWHPDNRTIYGRGGQGSTRQVIRIDTFTGEVERLTNEAGLHDQVSISADGHWLICTYRSPTSLPEIYRLSTDGRERRAVTRMSGRLRPFRLVEAGLVRWPAPDGLELEGMLVKPLDQETGSRYPLIVDLHEGPVEGGMAAFYPQWHWLAAQGYMVFGPDFRGGQTYGWCPPPDYLEHDFHDVMAGVDWLVEQGEADSDRVGVMGFSYGAWLAAWALGQTRRFRAAVIAGGLMNHMEAAYGTAISGGNPLLAGELGGRPWEAPEVYRYYSPLTYAPQVRTPTLILQGEQDSLYQAELIYTWLRQAGVEVEFVKYLGEGHGLQRPEHREDYWRRTLAWFDRHLQG